MNHPRAPLLCIAASLLCTLPARSQTRDRDPLTTIDVPGASVTFAIDINSGGEIVGRYLSAGRTHGFHRSPNGDLTTIDFPGAVFTVAAAVDDHGDVVGMYRMPSEPTSVRHGYLMRDGTFTTIDPPG